MLQERLADGKRRVTEMEYTETSAIRSERSVSSKRVVIVAGIAPVGDQEDNLAAVAPAGLEHLARGVEGVIEVIGVLVGVSSRAAARPVPLGSGWPLIMGRRRRGIGNDLRGMRAELEALELGEKLSLLNEKSKTVVGILRR